MNRDKKCPLLAKPSPGTDKYQSITSGEAGWKYLNFAAGSMKAGQ